MTNDPCLRCFGSLDFELRSCWHEFYMDHKSEDRRSFNVFWLSIGMKQGVFASRNAFSIKWRRRWFEWISDVLGHHCFCRTAVWQWISTDKFGQTRRSCQSEMGAIKRHLVIKHSMLVLVLTCKRAHTHAHKHSLPHGSTCNAWKLRETWLNVPDIWWNMHMLAESARGMVGKTPLKKAMGNGPFWK